MILLDFLEIVAGLALIAFLAVVHLARRLPAPTGTGGEARTAPTGGGTAQSPRAVPPTF